MGHGAMKPIHIDVVAFEDDGYWIAQCIQYDIVARADNLTLLPRAIEREITANICINHKLGREHLEGVPPAPDRFRELFKRAKMTIQSPELATNSGVCIDQVKIAEAA